MGRSISLPRGNLLRIVIVSVLAVALITFYGHHLPSVPASMKEHVSQYASTLHLDEVSDQLQQQSSSHDGSSMEDSAASLIPSYSSSALRPSATAATASPIHGCPASPNPEDFLISMKTGATELFAKLPQQLLTTLRCVKNYMIFSDIEQDIGDHHVYSSLKDVSDKYKYGHRDFEYYRHLVDLSVKGQDLSLLNDKKQGYNAGWDLDKWKFVPIAHRTYLQQPNAKWYIFLEADAYMAWSNTLELLSLYDHSKPWYLGATHFYGDVAFAHGGMGYMISNEAMRLLDAIWDPQHIAKWERRVAAGCCGDVEIAAVLREAGVNITGIPGLYGESLSWFEWEEGKWCEPSLSWHHLRSHDVEALWNFEKQLLADGGTHYVYRDLFIELVEPHLLPARSDWDNMSRHRIYTGSSGTHGDEDRRYPREIDWKELSPDEQEERYKDLNDEQQEAVQQDGKYIEWTVWDELSDEEKEAVWEEFTESEKVAHTSLRQCRAACEDWDECIQYYFQPGRCHLHRNVRLGHYVEPEASDMALELDASHSTVSGWMKDRVEDLKNRVGACKAVPDWMSDYAEAELSS